MSTAEFVLKIIIAFLSIIALAVVTNVLGQRFAKRKNEPPVVFHWIPFIGSTVTYGIDPFKFFFDCQAKVRPSFDPASPFPVSKIPPFY